MKVLFKQIFFEPLYNALVVLSVLLPGHDLGLAIILLTLIVKILLFPLQHKFARTQMRLKKLEPAMRQIKKDYAKDRTEQTRRTLALYKEHGINPFSGFVLLLVQLPIFIALFYVFRNSFQFDSGSLYSFVTPPAAVNTQLFGLIDVSKRSYFLAVLVGVSQFVQVRLASPRLVSPPSGEGQGLSLQEELTRSLQIQAKYVFPVLAVFISLSFPAALALYWNVSNLWAILHELWVRRQVKTLPAD